MSAIGFDTLIGWGVQRFQAACRQIRRRTRPLTRTLVGGMLADVTRSKRTLVAENALLRQQRIVLQRQVKRPALTSGDRRSRQAIGCAWCCAHGCTAGAELANGAVDRPPDTLLRWHRQG